MQKETDQVSCWYELAAEIIIQACDDWRSLCNGKTEERAKNFIELEQFFNSPWCSVLLTNTTILPEDILKKLQAERRAAEF